MAHLHSSQLGAKGYLISGIITDDQLRFSALLRLIISSLRWLASWTPNPLQPLRGAGSMRSWCYQGADAGSGCIQVSFVTYTIILDICCLVRSWWLNSARVSSNSSFQLVDTVLQISGSTDRTWNHRNFPLTHRWLSPWCKDVSIKSRSFSTHNEGSRKFSG